MSRHVEKLARRRTVGMWHRDGMSRSIVDAIEALR
jgi:hypothetical protein